MTRRKRFWAASLAEILLLLAVCASAFAEGQKVDPCDDWRQRASETMLRVASAQSRTEEGLTLLVDLIRRNNAGDATARTAFERQRKRFGSTVEEAVTGSTLAAQEAERLKQLLKKAEARCLEPELHGMRWARWWFENHGPIVKMRAGYLAAARLDFARAQSIFEEVIASGGESKNPESKRENDRAKRALAMVKMKKVPFLQPERSYQERENPGKVPAPEYIPKPAGGQP